MKSFKLVFKKIDVTNENPIIINLKSCTFAVFEIFFFVIKNKENKKK